jgi:ATP-dependent DNA helicase RecG
MVELNMIDTQGGGIKRMFETQRRRSFPLPDYELGAPGEVTVSVSGRILDERYTRLLMEQPGLSLGQVILLDCVQKRQRITHAEHQRLRQAGLVEGRYPNTMVAAAVAKATGDAARHIRERGFNKRYYVDLILALVQEHGPVGRREVDELLLSKLPDRMTAEQKRRKVHNLLQELRRAGHIANQGSRAEPRWVIAQPQSAPG